MLLSCNLLLDGIFFLQTLLIDKPEKGNTLISVASSEDLTGNCLRLFLPGDKQIDTFYVLYFMLLTSQNIGLFFSPHESQVGSRIYLINNDRKLLDLKEKKSICLGHSL